MSAVCGGGGKELMAHDSIGELGMNENSRAEHSEGKDSREEIKINAGDTAINGRSMRNSSKRI